MSKRPTLLPVKPYKQKPDFCGPSCLKQLFQYYGVDATEAAIARVAGGSHKFGTSPTQMVRAARAYGFDAIFKENASIADIRRLLRHGIPVIVDWFSVDDGHYSIAVGIDTKNIYLQDPELGRLHTLSLKTFKRVWFDFRGDFIRNKQQVRLRGIIVVTPSK